MGSDSTKISGIELGKMGIAPGLRDAGIGKRENEQGIQECNKPMEFLGRESQILRVQEVPRILGP